MKKIKSLPRNQLLAIAIAFNTLWTVLLIGTYFWTVNAEKDAAVQLAERHAKASYDKDVMYREWVASKGGVYASIEKNTPPNPFLKNIPERDISTPSGIKLTLVNPAYMTRQVHELSDKKYKIKGHITSLQPIRPENKPDNWEKEALKKFDNGIESTTAVAQINGKTYLRYMNRFVVDESCLKCHAAQGYQVGDIRGGISISVPLSEFYEVATHQSIAHTAVLVSIWLAGILLFNYGIFVLRRNINAYEQVEQSLKESRDQLIESQHIANLGSFSLDIPSGMWTSTEILDSLFGIDSNFERSADGGASIIHPDDRQMVMNYFTTEVVKQGEKFDKEYRIIRKNDQAERWVHGIGRLDYDEEGNPVRLQGTIQDITEHKLAQKALINSEEKFRAIFEHAGDYILLLKPQAEGAFLILDANKAACKKHGYSRDELIGKPITILNHEKNTAIYPERLKKIISDGHLLFETIHYTKAGVAFPVEVSVKLVDGLEDQTPILISIERDITKRKEAEKKLRELDERFRVSFYTSPDSVNINKMDGTYLDINEGFTKLTGFTRNDVIGKTSADIDIWTINEDRQRLINGLEKYGYVRNLESVFRLKDGSFKTALMSASIITLKDEPHILSITRDITDIKKAQEKSAELEKRLQQSYKMEAIGTMAGGIAHDFNNILAIIFGNIEMAMYDIPEDNPAQYSFKQVLEAANRAKDLVQQILTFSRKSEHQLIPLQPHLIVKENLKLARSTIPTTVKISQYIESSNCIINGDPTQLHQLIINLCNNAVHAMDENGILTVNFKEVYISSQDISYKQNLSAGKYICLSVIDTGCGMSPETKEKVFEPFFTTKDVGEGTGMGLSVVHGIVENHNGFIEIETELGKGTAFNIFFPVIDSEKEQDEESRQEIPTGKEKILFVDDEKMIAEMGGKILKRLGYNATVKTNSVDALETFEASPEAFDLVITDQTMPNMSGADLAIELKKINPNIPIILCTGYSKKITNEKARELGISELMQKPLDRSQLATIIRKILDS